MQYVISVVQASICPDKTQHFPSYAGAVRRYRSLFSTGENTFTFIGLNISGCLLFKREGCGAKLRRHVKYFFKHCGGTYVFILA